MEAVRVAVETPWTAVNFNVQLRRALESSFQDEIGQLTRRVGALEDEIA